jgi:alcohol oxidase
VEYVKNRDLHPDAEDTIYSARASRLIVVSGGAFGSPTILERSGIGGKSILEKYNVRQIVDLPGVGQNYQGTYDAY